MRFAVVRRTVRVSSTYVPRERVYAWHGTSVNDEYWHYCVNEGKESWMDDGNAYCIRPAYRDQSAWITGG